MMVDGPRIPTRRCRRGRLRVALLYVLAGPASAGAQEPLFLRIRPPPEPGSAAAARAAHEAVWARSQARARAVLASICTGCLAPWTAPPSETPPRPPAAAETRVTTAGLATDPGSEASEPDPDPQTPERRP